jgi:hypothetical protein
VMRERANRHRSSTGSEPAAIKLRQRYHRCLVAALGATAVAALVYAHARPPAPIAAEEARAAGSGAPPTAGDSLEPVLGLPEMGVRLLGASPGEAPQEAWALGGGELVEHTGQEGGWQVLPLPLGSEGEPVSVEAEGARVTGDGGVLLRVAAGGTGANVHSPGVVLRDPGGQPRLVAAPEATSDGAGTTLGGDPPAPGGSTSSPEGNAEVATFAAGAYAATDETGGHTGILLAEAGGATGFQVLRYDGSEWTKAPESIDLTEEQEQERKEQEAQRKLEEAQRKKEVEEGKKEPRELKKPEGRFKPERIACGPTATAPLATSPQDCWLLAAYGKGQLALFRRTVSSEDPAGYSWQPVEHIHESFLGEAPTEAGHLTLEALSAEAQMLTVTTQGVWVDFGTKLAGATEASYASELIAPAEDDSPPRSLGRWCYPTGPGCPKSLGGALSGPYSSVAWPAASGEGVGGPGIRILARPNESDLLELPGGSEGSFAATPAAGMSSAAFDSPAQGWLDVASHTGDTADFQGQSQLLEVTSQPQGDRLQETPVPFRRPLLALAQAPGSTPGDPGAQAIAVGVEGETGRYVAGEGWSAEALYNSRGEAEHPTLRGVAWPEPERAYAVGDHGAMWVWRAATGLWEPDPAKDPNFVGNLTAIAFSTVEPNLGYAVGKGGVLLRYGKTWEQEPLPEDLQSVNFTSVAFAGNEALASFRDIEGAHEGGGLAVDEGSGWHIDPGVTALAGQPVLSKVAGLPDGGAVAAGPGTVIERDQPGGPWRFSQPLPEARNISALAAYREPGGSVRAYASIDLDEYLDPNLYPEEERRLEEGPFKVDVALPSAAGAPPLLAQPDPLPDTGYLLKETANGWSDMEHMALPAPGLDREERGPIDVPIRPDPVLALVVSPEGAMGLAVGGQTYDSTGSAPVPEFETAAAMRFPAGSVPANGTTPAAIPTTPGTVTFAVGGYASCINGSNCAGILADSPGPAVALSHAVQVAELTAANSPGGLAGFLYTGGPIPPVVNGSQFFKASEGVGRQSFQSFPRGPSDGGAPVRVIMLDYQNPNIQEEKEFLEKELERAHDEHEPAVVVGGAPLNFTLPEEASQALVYPKQAPDAAEFSAILVNKQAPASAYLFDYPLDNVQTVVSDPAAGPDVPAFGTGGLGYITAPTRPTTTDSLGANGFLIVEVDTAARNPSTNVVPVHARLEPNASQLALDATDGVLLRRSHVALFEGLARRPAGGVAVSDQNRGVGLNVFGAIPYDPIPFDCQGPDCVNEIPVDVTLTSSNPDKGAFVVHEPGVEPRAVLLGADKLPIVDEPRIAKGPHKGELTPDLQFEKNSNGEPINEKEEVVPREQSGTFCAFNAGTTTVSITTGGLTYSEPIAIQAGSVEYPCGTVPLKNPPRAEASLLTGIPLLPLAPSSPPQVNPQIQSIVPPLPPAAVLPLQPHHAHVSPPVLLPFIPLATPTLGPIPAIVPPPPPPVARPIPPSGTSQVYQSSVAPQEKREEEEATSLVGNTQFSAYYANEHGGGPGPWPVLLLVLIAAGAGTGIRRGTRSRAARQPALARARATSRMRGPRR